MITADLVRSILRLIGAISSSETPAADEATDTLEAMNMLLASWGATRFLSASTGKVSKTMTGALSYTIGPGGDINATRPTALYVVTYTLSGMDYDVKVIDYADYQKIGLKTVTGTIPEFIALKPDNPLSTIYLYPAPNTGTLTIDNIRPADELGLDDDLPYPPEWIRALKFNTAIEIAPEYGFSVSPELAESARESKAIVMRSMVSVPVASIDPLLFPTRGNNRILSDGV